MAYEILIQNDYTLDSVRDALAKFPENERVLVRINSGGGDVFEAEAIVNLLSQRKGGVDTQVDGIAAGAASYIAMVGETVTMSADASMMLCRSSAVAVGDNDEMTRIENMVRNVDARLVMAYIKHSNLTESQVLDAMYEETWFNADQAVESGLADKVLEASVL